MTIIEDESSDDLIGYIRLEAERYQSSFDTRYSKAIFKAFTVNS
jgi:hypothetical protein